MRLSHLGLNDNELRATPDFTEVKNTLIILTLSNNPIHTITGHEFSNLERLEKLDIHDTVTDRLPNLLLLPKSIIDIGVPDINCDDPMLSWVNFLRISGVAIDPMIDVSNSQCFKNSAVRLDYKANRIVDFSDINTPYNTGRFNSVAKVDKYNDFPWQWWNVSEL